MRHAAAAHIRDCPPADTVAREGVRRAPMHLSGGVESATLDYAIVSTPAGLGSLAAEWNALFERAGRGTQFFQSFNWCRHWCAHYLGGHALAIVTGRSKGRLVLVWPLVATREGGVLTLSSLGAPVSQYSDALVEPSPNAQKHLRGALESAIAAVKADVVQLPHVREDASIAPLMTELGARATRRREAPYVDLSGAVDLDAYMRRYSAHSRKKFRAAGRRLAALGKVAFAEIAEGARARAMARDIVDVKRDQLAERGLISPAFAGPQLAGFLADVAADVQHPTGTRIHALTCGEDRAAANITFACKDRMIGHVFTFDSRFANENVGSQLLHQSIKRASEDGYRTFDLLAPADAYKLRCADGTVGVVDWAIPVSGKGALRARLRRLRPVAKMLLHLLPESVRRALAQRYYRRG